MKNICLLAISLFIYSGTALFADTHEWHGAGTGGNTATDQSDPSTLWGTASNWTPAAIPASGDTAWLRLTDAGYVNAQNASISILNVDGSSNEGALFIGPDIAFTPSTVYLGNNARGRVIQTGGTDKVNNLYLGYNAGSSGSYWLLDGQLTGHVYIGYSGSGTFTQTGGSNTSTLSLGYNVGSSGSYLLSDGVLTGSADIGYSGSGTFTQTGGTNKANYLALGHEDDASGSYSLSDGQLTTSQVQIGGYGSGTFLQTGGTHTVNNNGYLFVGLSAHSKGDYILSDGQLIVQVSEYVGRLGTGTFAQTGGTNTAGKVRVGASSGSNGTYSLSGGDLIVQSAETLGGEDYGAGAGTGTFVQSGGTNTVGGCLSIGEYVGSTGSYSLSNGELSVTTDEYIGRGGTGAFTQSGGTHTVAGSLIVGPQGIYTLVNGNLVADSLSASGLLEVRGGTLTLAKTLGVQSRLTLTNANMHVGGLSLGGTVGARMEGSGTIVGQLVGDGFSQIVVSGGDLSVGDSTSWNGFRTAGTIAVGANSLTLNSRAFSVLGSLTTLEGGTLRAADGVFVPGGGNVVGSGLIIGRISAAVGSTIAATANLALGDVNAYDGFYSDGVLSVAANTVTVNDRNEAVLGSLTTLGEGAAGGTLTAGNARPTDTYAHFLLEQGKNLTGRGQVNGNFKNNGNVVGDGAAAGECIVFNSPWTVSGTGTFANVLILGTFAPGEGVGVTTGANQAFAGTVQTELGGTTAGAGSGHHDQVQDSATMRLEGSPVLSVVPSKNFVPALGDQFEIMTWQDGLVGTFHGVQVDPWFASQGVSFALGYDNPGGAGHVTLTAIPKPSLLAWNGSATGDDNWTSIANWGGATPVADVQVQFGAAGHTSNYNNLATDSQFNGITFASDAPSYDLKGNPIKLAGPVVNHSSNDQTISLGMEFVSGGGLFDTGAKNVTVAGGLSGLGPLTKTGSGILNLSHDNTYTGGTVVSAGMLQVETATALPPGKSLTIGNGANVVLQSELAVGSQGQVGNRVVVPEPSTLALLGISAIGLLAYGWRRWKLGAAE